jgi:hypothetical protein
MRDRIALCGVVRLVLKRFKKGRFLGILPFYLSEPRFSTASAAPAWSGCSQWCTGFSASKKASRIYHSYQLFAACFSEIFDRANLF